MPVRRVGLCYRSVSGDVPMGLGRSKVTVESILERDFALLCRFDPSVTTLEEQPISIHHQDGINSRQYTPDFLVQYADRCRPSSLVEIKYSDDPALLAGELEPQFCAARRYACERGWEFSVKTERDIRTERLKNATFLLAYRSRRPNPQFEQAFLERLNGAGTLTVASLAGVVNVPTALILPSIWRLLATHALAADFDRPLSMTSEITLAPR